MNQKIDLDAPLWRLPYDRDKFAEWTIRHAVEGVQIFGGIGSGKTSGSGRMLALKYLTHGFGGLVLTAKPDEAEMWRGYARLTGREKDLIVLEPGGAHSFNFMDYEAGHGAGQTSITDNLVEVLKTVIRAGNEKESGRTDDGFWDAALDLLLVNLIDLCKLAYGRVAIEDMYEIVQTLPKRPVAVARPEGAAEATRQGDEDNAFVLAQKEATAAVSSLHRNWEKTWTEEQKELYRDKRIRHQDARVEIPEFRLLEYVGQFFKVTFGMLSEKTRSIVDFSFSSFLYGMLRDPAYSLFCKYESTFTPDDSLKGKIIILNLPVKTYHKVGRDCQILFKYVWQRAMERRNVKENNRPVFLWADEAQNFLHEHDAVYQATARSSMIATVYISQNLPNYYASMGGQRSEHRVESFLGTLGTKIFHANADVKTNDYASQLFGDAAFEDYSTNANQGEKYNEGQNVSIVYDRAVRPEEFVKLRTGGELNNFQVKGYFHRQGDPLFGDRSYELIIFNQTYQPR